MKKLLLAIFLGMFVMACTQTSRKPESGGSGTQAVAIADTVKDGMFIHITESYNDPHRVLMPLKMAKLMAKDKDVLVYMDIHAVEILVKGAKDLKMGDFESAHTYIKDLIDSNVGIYACPSCLKVAGFNPEDLMEGVKVADKDKFFNFTEGRIITLDY